MKTTPEINTHLLANSNLSIKEIMISNLLGGFAWGFGTVIGGTIVIAVLAWILSHINFIPVIGNFAADIMNIVNSHTK